MRSKDKELIAAIERFIRNFTDNAGVSPTMQEVADGVGSTKSTVQRYIVQMRKDGILDSSGYRTMVSSTASSLVVIFGLEARPARIDHNKAFEEPAVNDPEFGEHTLVFVFGVLEQMLYGNVIIRCDDGIMMVIVPALRSLPAVLPLFVGAIILCIGFPSQHSTTMPLIPQY